MEKISGIFLDFLIYLHHSSCFKYPSDVLGASQVALEVKSPSASAGDIRNAGSVPGLGRSPAEGHSNPLQYSSLENSMDRGAWQATVYRVAKSQTRMKWLNTHTHTHIHWCFRYLFMFLNVSLDFSHWKDPLVMYGTDLSFIWMTPERE